MTASDHSYESPKDRAGLAREAGLGRLSFPSILAGVLVAYGAFAVLAALAGTVAAAIGLNTDLNRNDWATLSLGSAIAVAVVLLAAYLFGGYVAGRMARRAGLLNGLAVFLLALLLVAVVGAVAASQTDAEAIGSNLRSLGIPTSGTEWGKAGTAAGIGSLAAMLVGALLGGVTNPATHEPHNRAGQPVAPRPLTHQMTGRLGRISGSRRRGVPRPRRGLRAISGHAAAQYISRSAHGQLLPTIDRQTGPVAHGPLE